MFFEGVNHSVSHNVMQEMRRATRGFFGLPLEVKQKWTMKEGEIFGFGRFNVGNQLGVTDWVDLLAHFVAPESFLNDETKEPQNFVQSMCALVSESLGLEPDYIQKTSGGALRLNYYPPCPEPNKVLGLGSHSDGGTFTILMQDGSAAGLQVLHKGQWITVNMNYPNALLVNVADMLEVVISNGRYTSVNHHAIVNKDEERYSIVLFYYPEMAPDVYVRPAPSLLTKNKPAMYKEVTYLEYISFYLQQRMPGKSRIDSLKINKAEAPSL
ncbi:hypothetical protein L7F22_033832 [Adiantum nelumboides]|nr:hypothetical protein [Adiantum nelumboides]